MNRDRLSPASCLLLLASCLIGACAKPLVRASAKMMEPVAQSFAADTNRIYYAVRAALAARNFPVASEDLPAGILTTGWRPTSVDSHFVQPFRTPDYGVIPSYHQLEIRIVPEGAQTRVEVASRLKSVAAFVRSSEREERALLKGIADQLRRTDPEVTNVGIEE